MRDLVLVTFCLALLSCGGTSIEEYGRVVESARACTAGDVCVLSPAGKGCACASAINQSQAAKVQDAYDSLDCGGAEAECALATNPRCENNVCVAQ